MTDVQTAETHAVVRKLKERMPSAALEVSTHRGELTVVVPSAEIRAVGELLLSDSDCKFVYLSDITGVDRFPVEPRFELNYHLVSLERRERLRIKARVSGPNPVVQTVVPLWPTANWHEREIFDLLGVRFEGHPDLRRILMPENWEGHPLRKDYPVEGVLCPK